LPAFPGRRSRMEIQSAGKGMDAEVVLPLAGAAVLIVMVVVGVVVVVLRPSDLPKR
jgi:hypothetical protein